MSELERQVSQARELMQVDVSVSDTTQAILRLHATRRRRTRVRFAAAGGLAVAAVALGLFVARPALDPSPAPGLVALPDLPEAEAPEPELVEPEVVRFATSQDTPKRTLVFSDGSMAVLVQPRTQLRMEAYSEDLLELTLASGEARFVVQKNPQRLFRVRTADLRVEVLGTKFSVATDPEGFSEVKVHEGRVAVYRGQDRHELGANMRFTWDGERVVIEDEGKVAPRPKAKRRRRGTKRRAGPAPRVAAPNWTALADEGRFDDAYVAMKDEVRRPSDAAELMLAADVARLSGHPKEATRYLEQVIADHPEHARGLLAAFTLGRILQRELDDPRGAAEAFRTARLLAPTGSLAEDALAHEAECWGRAGESERARDLARKYLAQYPRGRKAGSMRRLVGAAP